LEGNVYTDAEGARQGCQLGPWCLVNVPVDPPRAYGRNAFRLWFLLKEISMHRDHNIFVQAIKDRRKIRLIYSSEAGDTCLFQAKLSAPMDYSTKLSAPMDYHPDHRATDKSDCYYFWDFEESNNGDPLILEPDKIISMDLDKETFEPSDFVTWDVRELPWFLKRDWGKFS
jgi:hypothetical protein